MIRSAGLNGGKQAKGKTAVTTTVILFGNEGGDSKGKLKTVLNCVMWEATHN